MASLCQALEASEIHGCFVLFVCFVKTLIDTQECTMQNGTHGCVLPTPKKLDSLAADLKHSPSLFPFQFSPITEQKFCR